MKSTIIGEHYYAQQKGNWSVHHSNLIYTYGNVPGILYQLCVLFIVLVQYKSILVPKSNIELMSDRYGIE